MIPVLALVLVMQTQENLIGTVQRAHPVGEFQASESYLKN